MYVNIRKYTCGAHTYTSRCLQAHLHSVHMHAQMCRYVGTWILTYVYEYENTLTWLTVCACVSMCIRACVHVWVCVWCV